MSQYHSSEFQPLNSRRSIDAMLERMKVESDERAIPNFEQSFHAQPTHVPYVDGCGFAYHSNASPRTTSDDVVVIEELGDNYSCHVYATSGAGKMNMPHEGSGYVNYNTFSTFSDNGFFSHGLYNDMGTYNTDQPYCYFDQNLNDAWFGTFPNSNTFQQDQCYCSLRHNAPFVNDLDQNCHSQWTSPFPGCGVPINNSGAMNRSVYDNSTTHYHDNENGYNDGNHMHDGIPKCDARTTNHFTPIEIPKKKRPPPPGFEHVVPTPRRFYPCVNKSGESHLFRKDSSERNNDEQVENEDDLYMSEHASLHQFNTPEVETMESRVVSQDCVNEQKECLKEETQERIEGHDRMEGVKIEVDAMAQRRPSKEGNVLASSDLDSGHSLCHHSITLSNDSSHSLSSMTTFKTTTDDTNSEENNSNKLVIEELEEDNNVEEYMTNNPNGCFPCKIMTPIFVTKDLARRFGSVLQTRKKESKRQSTKEEASHDSRLCGFKRKIGRILKSIFTCKH